MSVNAKPYQEGKGWVIRARYKGHDIYKSGQKTAAAAVKSAGKEIAHIDKMGQPAWGGPKDRTVAQAMQRYALQTLPFKKGGDQEARRINRFLRHAGVDEIVLTKLARPEQTPAPAADGELAGKKPKPGVPQKPLQVYFSVETKPAQQEAERAVPNSLKDHRQMLCVKTADSDRLRKQIACCKFTKLSTDLLQAFVGALTTEGAAAATVYQEVAVLRQLGNHARARWKWREPEVNPASGLELPAIKNERDRVMSIDEQHRLLKTLANRRAKGVVELVALATETAMRAEEIIGLTWSEVHTDQRLIKLDESKTGARDVPLSTVAIELLDKLGQGPRTGPVFTGMTYSKLPYLPMSIVAASPAMAAAAVIDFYLRYSKVLSTE